MDYCVVRMRIVLKHETTCARIINRNQGLVDVLRAAHARDPHATKCLPAQHKYLPIKAWLHFSTAVIVAG